MVLLAGYWAYVHLSERRPVKELSVPGAAIEGLAGLLLGGVLFASVMAVLAAIAFAVVYLLAQLLRAYPTVVGGAVVLAAIGFGAWGMSVHRAAPHDQDGADR